MIIERPKGDALYLNRGVWHVHFYKNGKSTNKSLKTKDKEEAILKRDEFFKDLKIHKHKANYIHYQKPWRVKLPNGFSERFDTEEEAIKVRDREMKKLENVK